MPMADMAGGVATAAAAATAAMVVAFSSNAGLITPPTVIRLTRTVARAVPAVPAGLAGLAVSGATKALRQACSPPAATAHSRAYNQIQDPRARLANRAPADPAVTAARWRC